MTEKVNMRSEVERLRAETFCLILSRVWLKLLELKKGSF